MADEAVGKKVLSMEEFLAINDEEFFEVPVGNDVLLIGSLTADDFIEWQEANEGPAKRTAGLRLIVKSMVNKEHQRVGTDRHLELLKKKSVKVTEQVVKAIVKLNGLSVKGEGDAKNG